MVSSPNKLLASLSANDFDLIEPNLESVFLGVRKSLEKPNQCIKTAYFPESGFVSVVAVQSSGKEVEIGLIGREGMTGTAIVFGNHRSPHATYVQAEGSAKSIPATALRDAMRTSQSLAGTPLSSPEYVNSLSPAVRLGRGVFQRGARVESDVISGYNWELLRASNSVRGSLRLHVKSSSLQAHS